MSLKIPTDDRFANTRIVPAIQPAKSAVLLKPNRDSNLFYHRNAIPTWIAAMRIGKKNTVLTWERMVALSLLIPTFFHNGESFFVIVAF